MGKVIPFRRRSAIVVEPGTTHELSLQWAERRTKVKAICRCGIEFGRWRPEHGSPKENLAPVRKAYREHVAEITGKPLSYGAAWPVSDG